MPSHHASDDVSEILFASSATGLDFPIPAVGPVAVSRTGVVHRRGLVATRDISPGENLFVVDPTATAPPREVRSRWEKSDSDGSLENFAEEVLLEDMMRCLESDEAAAASFMALFGDDGGEHENIEAVEDGELMDLLLGKVQPERKFDATDKEKLLGIVRRNAFGPDYSNYSAIEKEWLSQGKEGKEHHLVFDRLLGIYPFPAIINHSCEPNAVRIFGAGETMIAHATTSIKKGQEIVWSYIPPTQTYQQRQKQIASKYGFRCTCARCQNEGNALGSIDGLTERLANMDELNLPNLLVKGIPQLEEILQDKRFSLSNESKRFFRIGYTNLFMNDFNSTLLDLASQITPSDANEVREKVLAQATQLHFSFAACHNASTEHLSILHLCYELISFIHASSSNQGKTIVKVRFWTEQIKRAHMVRYGCLGNDLENVRRVMKHTRLVLRNREGLKKAEASFL